MSSAEIRPRTDIHGNILVPLSSERKKQIMQEIVHGIGVIAKDMTAELRSRGEQKVAMGEQKIIAGKQKIAAAQAGIAKAEAEERAALASIEQLKTERAQQQENFNQRALQHDQKLKELCAKTFYGVFYGKVATLPPGIAEKLFTEYLSNDEFSILRDPVTRRGYVQANSTKPFARFLEANSDIRTCDFRIFQDKIVDNMLEFATVLSKIDCSVNTVWINSKVSEETKAYLEKAAQIRDGGLTINYV